MGEAGIGGNFLKYHKIGKLLLDDGGRLFCDHLGGASIEYIGSLIFDFSEKVNGTNIGINWDGSIKIEGRTENADLRFDLMSHLNELFKGKEELFNKKFGIKSVVIYGEGYGSAISDCRKYSKEPRFIVFDVCIEGVFLERKNVEEIAKFFGLNVVPIVFTGTLREGIEFIKNKCFSVLAEEEVEMEGLVACPKIRLYDVNGNRIMVKLKRKYYCDERYKGIK